MTSEGSDESFLRMAIALARQAREAGADPFGAVLVRDGVIMHQGQDLSLVRSDPTAHAELSAISEYCRQANVVSLEGYTLYSSTEPCPMCSGAIHWARISRVVYSVPQARLQQLSGGTPKPSCESIVNMGRRRVEVVGPLLLDEGLAVFEGHRFVSKAERLKDAASSA